MPSFPGDTRGPGDHQMTPEPVEKRCCHASDQRSRPSDNDQRPLTPHRRQDAADHRARTPHHRRARTGEGRPGHLQLGPPPAPPATAAGDAMARHAVAPPPPAGSRPSDGLLPAPVALSTAGRSGSCHTSPVTAPVGSMQPSGRFPSLMPMARPETDRPRGRRRPRAVTAKSASPSPAHRSTALPALTVLSATGGLTGTMPGREPYARSAVRFLPALRTRSSVGPRRPRHRRGFTQGRRPLPSPRAPDP